MIHVAALTSGRNVPSARFRVRQHIPLLREMGIRVDEYCPIIDKFSALRLPPKMHDTALDRVLGRGWAGLKLAARVPGILGSHRASITWLERELIAGLITLEQLLKRPYVFDVDDAIWVVGPQAPESIAQIGSRAAMVIAGNSFIAQWFSSFTDRIRIVPTAVDTD